MYLWIQQRNKSYQFQLDANHCLTIDDIQIIFQKEDTFYQIYDKEDKIVPCILPLDQITPIQKKNTELLCSALLHQEYTRCIAYSLQDPITIGETDTNDIVLLHPACKDIQVILNPNTRQYTSNIDVHMQTYSILKMVEVQLPYVHIFLFDAYILIAENAFITIHLQQISIPQSLFYLPQKEILYNHIPKYTTSFIEHFNATSPMYSIQETRPLFLTIAPSLFMSIASLLAGSMMAYQNYERGLSLWNVLPSLLLPCTMLLSTICIYPLTHYYEKSKAKKKYQQQLDNQSKLQQEYIDCFTAFIEAYQTYVSLYFYDSNTIVPHIIESKQIQIHPSSQSLTFRIGQRSHIFSILEENPTILSKLEEYQNQQYPWLISMHTYPHIAILQDAKTIPFLQYVILQYVLYYDTPLILAVQEIQKYPYLLQVANTMYNHERMISSNGSQIQKWCDQFEKQEGLLISIDVPLSAIKMKYTIEIVQSFTQGDYQLCIDLDKQTCFDALECKQYDVIYEQHNFFYMQLLLFCLRRNYEQLLLTNHDFISVQHYKTIDINMIQQQWKENHPSDSLQAMIGTDGTKQIILDLHEKKDGPHGLIGGMTGSGKSEALLSLVVSLALRYSYEDVQFAILDFKGGGIAHILSDLPHVVGVLSNLDGKHMQRALIALGKECEYRQSCIAELQATVQTPIMHIHDYRKQQSKQTKFPKLSDLIVIVDEFAQLKQSQPEFLSQLISIARIGRSLGIHLILSTQKPSGVVSEEIWANCSFKMAFQVVCENDSNDLIRCKDAYDLSRCGEFILLKPDGKQKGIGAYINSPYLDTSVEIVEVDGSFQQKQNTKTITQLQYVLSLFQNMAIVQKQKLWYEPLGSLQMSSTTPIGVFARADDYYARSQFDMYLLDDKKRNTVFILFDHNEKQNLLYTLLYVLDNQTILYMIDDCHFPMQEIYERSRNWSEIVASSNHEKIHNLFTYIQSNQEEEKTLIITDITTFLQNHDQHASFLHDLLEHASLYKIHLILLTTSFHVFSYKDQPLIQTRYILNSENIQEIQYTFETSEKITCHKKGMGICKHVNLIPFCLYTVTYQQLLDKLPSHTIQKTHRIQTMPTILIREHQPDKIQIGMRYDTYTWHTIPIDACIYVVSMYKQEWLKYYEKMKYYCKCTTRKDKDEEDGHLIFLSVDEYKQSHQSYPVLYIGASFSMQYIWISKVRKLEENDGILFTEYENTRLKII